jgi:hypothetical protein
MEYSKRKNTDSSGIKKVKKEVQHDHYINEFKKHYKIKIATYNKLLLIMPQGK